MRLGAARRDWLQQLGLVCIIMLMRLQELCKLFLFHCKWANSLSGI